MASILDFLDTDTGKQFVQSSSQQLGESPERVKSALAMAMPMMLGALKKNAQTQQGAEGIDQALEDQKHDGSILGRITEVFQGENLGMLISDGGGILRNIFGGNQPKVEEAVGTATGMDSSKIGSLLKMVAPVVLGILGNQKRKDQVGAGGLSGLLESVMGSDTAHDQSLLETFMEGDKNSVIGDVAGKLFGKKGGSKGLGDFFKG